LRDCLGFSQGSLVRYVTERKGGAVDWTDCMDLDDDHMRLAEMQNMKFRAGSILGLTEGLRIPS
jgi:hypothetical protein